MFLTGVGGSQNAMKQIKAGGLYRATFLYNPNMAATSVNMARLIALGQGFSELGRGPLLSRSFSLDVNLAAMYTSPGEA